MTPKVHITAKNQISICIDKKDPDCYDNEVEQVVAMSPQELLDFAWLVASALSEIDPLNVYSLDVIELVDMANEHQERDFTKLLDKFGL